MFSRNLDILKEYSAGINFEEISRISEERYGALFRPHWEEVLGLLERLAVKPDQELAEQAIAKLFAWRKGPFTVFGHEVDAEWQSGMKWERVRPELGNLKGKRLLDVGCGNGYYLLQAQALEPELIVGLDPMEKYFLQYELVRLSNPMSRVSFLPLGAEHCPLFGEFFDCVMCLGVIYHQRNPVQMLLELKAALKPGGELVLESLVIPGEKLESLLPKERYAKMRNIHFVPTVNHLKGFMEEAGFVDVEMFSVVMLTSEEQRATRFSPGESLIDFLNPADPSLTVEGYPAPRRACLKGFKPR